MLAGMSQMQASIAALAGGIDKMLARSGETASILSRANLDNLREKLESEDEPEELDALNGFMRRFNQVWGDDWSPDEVFGVDPTKRAS